jgi:hypothetical protein
MGTSVLREVGRAKQPTQTPQDEQFERDPMQKQTGFALLNLLRHSNIGGWSDDRNTQVQKFEGVTYIAIRAVMDLIGGSTFQIVRKKKPRRNRTTFTPGPFTKAITNSNSHAHDDDYVPFDDVDHPLVRLIERPNPHQTFGELAASIVLQNRLTGVGPMWAVPSVKRRPVELWSLKTPALIPLFQWNKQYPNGMWKIMPFYTGSYGMMPSYASQYIGAAGAQLPGEEVPRFLDPHPFFDWDGFSPLTAASYQLDVLEMIDQSRFTMMDNGVNINAILIAPGMPEEYLEKAKEKLESRHSGVRNAGRLAAIAPPPGATDADKVTLQTLTGNSAKDMEYNQGWEQMTKFCLSVFGVPAGVAGLESAGSYSKLYADIKQFHFSQGHYAHRLGEWFTKALAWPYSEFFGQYRVQIDLPKIENEDLAESRLGTDIPNGGVTFNEYRALRGRRTVGPEGDIPVPLYLKMLEQKLMPQPEQPPGGMPGMPPGVDAMGGMPGMPGAEGGEQEDPLAGLLGGGDEKQEGDVDDSEQGTKNATVEAALQALGMGGDEEPDAAPITKAAKAATAATATSASGGGGGSGGGTGGEGKRKKRQNGEKWQVNGQWYMKENDQIRPIADPNKAKSNLGDEMSPEDFAEGKDFKNANPKKTDGAPQEGDPEGWGNLKQMGGVVTDNMYRAIEESLLKTGDVQSADRKSNGLIAQSWDLVKSKFGTNESTIKKFTDAWRAVGKGTYGKDLSKAIIASLNDQFSNPNANTQQPVQPGAEAKPTASEGGAPQAKPQPMSDVEKHDLANRIMKHKDGKAFFGNIKNVLGMNSEAVKTFAASLGITSPEPIAKAAESVPVTPKSKSVLQRAHEWADSQAGKHADKVAKHLGVDRDRAKYILSKTIKAVAEHALKNGGSATGVANVGGKKINVGFKYKGNEQLPNASKPASGSKGGKPDITPTKPGGGKPKPAPGTQGNPLPIPDDESKSEGKPRTNAIERVKKQTKTEGGKEDGSTAKRGLLGRAVDAGLSVFGTAAEKRLARKRKSARNKKVTGTAIPKPGNSLSKGAGVPKEPITKGVRPEFAALLAALSQTNE